MLRITNAAYKKLAPKSLVAPFERSTRLSEVFHENTKLGPLTGVAYYRHMLTVLKSPQLVQLLDKPGKVYSLSDAVPLDRPVVSSDIERMIANRRSERHFTGEAIPIEALSRLLHFSYGITDRKHGFRAVPSGGALYPLELYVVTRNVTGLTEGIYHYAPDRHRLDIVRAGEAWNEVVNEVGLQFIDVDQASALIIIAALFKRTTMKYLDRGYRLVLFEAGAVAQNLALLGGSLGIASCLLGGFNDDNLSRLLGANGVDEAPLVPIVIGARKGGAQSIDSDSADAE